MTFDEAEGIVDLMVDEGYEAEVRAEYSGRGMYGKTVVGIVADDIVLIGYFAAKAGVEIDDLPRRQDSMGTSIVVY